MKTGGVRARREKDEEELRVRYEHAIDSANQWMDRQYATKTRLADFLDVNRSCLTRFLNGTPGYQPARTRPSILRILERIEARCSVYDLVEHHDVEAPAGETFDDAYTWFHSHALRLRQLSERFEPVTALGLVAELSVQALHGPRGYRAAMANNVLHRLSGLIERDEVACATPKLLRMTVARVRSLEDVAMRGASEIEREDLRAAAPNRAKGWTGHVLGFCAVHLEDERLLAEGLQRLQEAVSAEHTLEDGHWANLLGLVDAMARRDHAGAEEIADEIADLGRAAHDEKLRYTITTASLPSLVRLWRTRAPDLVAPVPEDGHALRRERSFHNEEDAAGV